MPEKQMMSPSDACLELIERFEGFSARPYLCPAGRATIGYGSTRYEDGRPVSMGDPVISKARAGELLENIVAKFAADVNRLVRVPLEQHEFDALVCFAYNVGSANLAGSTLLTKLNAGDKPGAADQFLRWNMASGRVLAGLTNRRQAERNLFLGG